MEQPTWAQKQNMNAGLLNVSSNLRVLRKIEDPEREAA